MDIEDSVVDLSVKSLPPELSELKALTASGLTITPARPPVQCGRSRQSRGGRGDTDNSPDIVLLPARPPHVSVHAGSGSSSPNFQSLYGGLSIHHSLNPLAATHPRTPSRHDIYQPSPPKQPKTNNYSQSLSSKCPIPAYQPPDYSKYMQMSGGTSITVKKEKADKDIVALPVNIVPPEPPKMDVDESSSSEEEDEELNGELDPIFSIPAVALTPEQVVARQLSLRKLREELRREETKLVLLKKIRQSQQAAANSPAGSAKDGQAPPPAHRATVQGGTIGSGTSIQPAAPTQPPPPAHSNKTLLKPRDSALISNVPTTPSGLTVAPAGSPISNLPLTASLPGGATLTQGAVTSTQRSSSSAVSITPSVTITPAPQPAVKQNTDSATATAVSSSASSSVSSASSATGGAAAASPTVTGGTPQQRQAAAKLALRKQLEKTLLQIPPPKPPPPEMSFIPSPANADFVYLLGLEHVVDFLTSFDRVTATHSGVKVCSQCGTDFTPAWKWQPAQATRDEAASAINTTTNATGGVVVCERCVSGNVKRTLKAEHTARLKTAFVRALQQEHEIERRMAQPSPPAVNTPVAVTSVNGSSAVSTSAPITTGPSLTVTSSTEAKLTPSTTITASILPSLEKFASATLPDKYSLANNKDISIESTGSTTTPAPTSISLSTRHHNNIQVTLRPANPSPVPPSSSRGAAVPSPSHHSSHNTHNAHTHNAHSHSTHNAHTHNAHGGGGHTSAHTNKSNPTRSRHDQHDSHTTSRTHHSDRSGSAASSSSTVSAVERQNAKHQQQLAAAQLAAFEQHSAAAMHALQQQLFRGITSGNQAATAAAAAMMQFNPLLYPYQLAMAAGLAGKAGSGLPSVTDLQRAAELHRQYLLDMIPSQHSSSQANNHHQQWTNKK